MPFRMKGEYMKNCNCLASCPCDTIGVPAPHNFCEGMAGMRITEGEVDGVNLDGVKWVVTVHWPGALHEGNGTAEVFIDENTSQQQRDGLISILTGQQGGTFFEILSQIITTIHGPHFVPINWKFDKEKRRATVSIPGSFETESQPLSVPATGDEQRVIVRMPAGFEYKEMEVAQTSSLKSSGAIKFDWHGTHSSLAIVEQTDKGLMDGATAGAASG
jgi:hypothetical protein